MLMLPNVPKVHAMSHVVLRAKYQGNPGFSACWKDESLNKDLADIARSCHSVNLEPDLLSRIRRHLWSIADIAGDDDE